MKKRIWLLSIVSVIIVSAMVFATYMFMGGENSSNVDTINARIEKVEKMNEKKTNLSKEYLVDLTEYAIPSNLVNDNFISVNTFCQLSFCYDGGNYLEKNGFTFNISIDDYIVKEVNGVLVADIDAMANGLGFNCELIGDNFILTRTFANKRLIINETLNSNYGADTKIKYADATLFQYTTEFETFTALNDMLEDGVNVQNDAIFKIDDVVVIKTVAIETEYSKWDGQVMGLDKYKEYLQSLSQDPNEVIVAVLDTGINPNHELFRDRLIMEYAKNVSTATNYNPNYVIDDTSNGHGTHVAGTIAAWTPSNVKILPIKVFGSNGSGAFSDVYSALVYVNELIDAGVNIKIVNCSFGASAYIATGYDNFVNYKNLSYKEYQKMEDRGVIACVAAGNDKHRNTGMGNDNESYTYRSWPACFDNVITVSSVSRDYNLSQFSNFGKVDFCAPGEKIVSAYCQGQRGYIPLDGTSMATPHISAVFALLLSNPIENYNYAKALNVCKSMATIDLGNDGFDQYYGYGFIDLRILLSPASDAPYKDYSIVVTCCDRNGEQLINAGTQTFGRIEYTYFDKGNEVNTVTFSSVYNTNNYITTNKSIYFYNYLNDLTYRFVGWYLCDNWSFENPTLISTNSQMILGLDMIKVKHANNTFEVQKNYVYAMFEPRVVQVSVNFIFKDVDQYSGFASYGTRLNVNYTDVNDNMVAHNLKSSYLANDQVFTFDVVATKEFGFTIICENDSVIEKMIYLSYDVKYLDGAKAPALASSIKIPAFSDEDKCTIMVIILI